MQNNILCKDIEKKAVGGSPRQSHAIYWTPDYIKTFPFFGIIPIAITNQPTLDHKVLPILILCSVTFNTHKSKYSCIVVIPPLGLIYHIW